MYNFFEIIGRVTEATLIKFSLVTLLFGIYRVISLTDLSTGFIKPKITKITNLKKFNNKIILFLVHIAGPVNLVKLAWPKI